MTEFFSTVILPLWISCLQVLFGPGMAVAGELLEDTLEDPKGMLFNLTQQIGTKQICRKTINC